MSEASSIVLFVFIVGGAFGIIQGTGAIDAAIGRSVSVLQGKEKLLIPVAMFVFSLGGATFGLAEECLVFVPIFVAIAKAMGFDAITGVAIVSVGANAGFTGGFLNPFTTGVAQGIAELPLFSGIGLRFISFVMSTFISIWYTYRYSIKVKQDPKKSYILDITETEGNIANEMNIELPELTKRHKLVITLFILGLAILVYGVFKLGWYITEIAGLFVAAGIIAGLVGGSGINKISEDFINGAKDITFGALVVGLARGILVVMEQGLIIDSIIYGLIGIVSSLPKVASVIGVFIVQTIINFFIPSGSGQAAATMPIMVPLADAVGITRQTMVLAFEYGNGFTNSFFPTGGVLMAALSMAGIPYDRWFKWAGPLMIYWSISGAILLYIAVAINYGPF